MADTEALLFVNDQKTQIFVFDGFLQQFVGADNQIHTACLQIGNGSLLLGRGAETAEHINIDGESTET